MEFMTRGNPDNPLVLLIPKSGSSAQELYASLMALEKCYYLLIPLWSSAESMEDRAGAVEERVRAEHAGRVWGAYGLGEGGSLLLKLLARGSISVQTAIVEGEMTIPPDLHAPEPGRLIYWYGSKDKSAQRSLRILRKLCPELYTVKLKKLETGDFFHAIRPDLMIRRMKKNFGSARLIRQDVLLPAERDELWSLLTARDHAMAEGLSAVTAEILPRSTLLIRGVHPRAPGYRHLIHLERAGDGRTLCSHRVELSGGPFCAAAAVSVRAALKKEHRLWIQTLSARKKSRPI